MKEALSRLGARLGNWNDRRFGHHDSRADASNVWQWIDHLSGWLYVLPERTSDGVRR